MSTTSIDEGILDIAIVGGGIGGLATALALHRHGLDCTVFEAADALRPLGVGINLLPHSVRVLSALGLQPALAATAIETAELAFFNKHGQLVWSEPRGLAAGYAYPQFSIHRGELQMILFDAASRRLGATRLRTGHLLESFDDDGDTVLLRFAMRADGTTPRPVRARAVIAADGIHSAVRRRFHPDEGAPRFSGRMLWRATTVGAPFLTGRSMIQAGHQNQKFVCYPISGRLASEGRALINWIAELTVPGTAPPRQDWSRKVDKSVFAGPFAGWKFPWLDIPALIDGAESVYEYPMVDRDPLPRWTRGRVTLLGDAAHPMYPIGSNGASQAILDAESVADALALHRFGGDRSNPGPAFADYEAQRREATARIVLLNRQNGPDQVLQIAEERAPDGFDDIHDVIPREELEAIAARYKQVAGFSHQQVNRR